MFWKKIARGLLDRKTVNNGYKRFIPVLKTFTS